MTIAGDVQAELGCPGDWQPECAVTHLTYDARRHGLAGLVRRSRPATGEYKAALNNAWDESYGANTGPTTTSRSTSAPDQTVKFYYSHETHWVADSVTKVIAVAPGDFQQEMGCPGDWQPDCLRSWLQDPDGDGTFTFSTTSIPAGSYETKVALNETWDVNYGPGGVLNSPDNIHFDVPANAKVTFSYDGSTPRPDDPVREPGSQARQQRRVGRPAARLARHAVPHARRRAAGRHPDHAPLPDVPQRRHRREGCASSASTTAASSSSTMHAGGQRRGLLSGGPRRQVVRLLAGDPARRAGARTTCGTASSSPTAPTPTTTPTTPPRSTAAWARPPTTRSTSSWALMLYEPGFTAPAWAKDAVIYQIFPDRFRNGRTNNDPNTGDVRYDVPVVQAAAGASLPEGYCRNYADGDTNCPWRFDTTPPRQPHQEQPRGRDYMGGDLKGVDQQLDYLAALGVNTDLLQPDLRRRRRTTRTTRRTTQGRPVLRHAEGLGEPRQARRQPRDPDRPRRRVQPPVVGQPVLRPLPPLRDRRRLRVDELSSSAAGSCSPRSARATAPAPGPAAAPRRATTAGSASTRSR